MLDLQCHSIDASTRLSVKFSSAEEVAAQSQKAAELAADKKRQIDSEQITPRIEVSLPPSAKIVKRTDKQLNFAVGSGQAAELARAITMTLEAAGWKSTTNVLIRSSEMLVLRKTTFGCGCPTVILASSG
jgi:hypothetical protein